MIDKGEIERAVLSIIKAIGEEPSREGLSETPRRIAEMYAELFSGLHRNPVEELNVTFEEAHQELIILKDIPFFSLCEHHFLPFYGVVHIGYIPKGKIVGLSKLARVVDILARRPQVQERLTSQIADAIVEGLNPEGVGVVVEAEHLCMIMRGVKKQGSKVVTSAMRGLFRRSHNTRSEFLSLIFGDNRGRR